MNQSLRVQLVNATTKLPFKEHHKDGKRYVEVEPNAEYYIQIGRDNERTTRSTTKHEWVVLKINVDGVSLGYIHYFFKGPAYMGSWARKNGRSTMTSLQFRNPRLSTFGTLAASGGRSAVVGTVSVEFYKYVKTGMTKLGRDVESNVPSCKIGDLSPGKMVVRSDLGSVSMSHQESAIFQNYTTGEHLETITLNYGTAVGLIHVGVLPKPPLWSHAQVEDPFTFQADPELVGISPTIIKKEAHVVHGVTISKAMEWELFDLTHL